MIRKKTVKNQLKSIKTTRKNINYRGGYKKMKGGSQICKPATDLGIKPAKNSICTRIEDKKTTKVGKNFDMITFNFKQKYFTDVLDPENTDRITASTKQEKIDVLDKYFRDGKISAEEEKI